MTPHAAAPDPALERLALACRALAAHGHGDLNLGHLSLRTEDGAHFWMKRAGPGLDEVVPADLLLVDLDGNVEAGSGPLHVEWPIHAEIFRARPDVVAVGHTHGRCTAVLSAAASPQIRPLTHAGAMFPGGVPRFEESGNLISTPEAGRSLARCLAGSDAVLMRNHGATFCGASLEHATVAGIQLERAAEAELTLRAAGDAGRPAGEGEAREKRAAIYTDSGVRSMFEWCLRRVR